MTLAHIGARLLVGDFGASFRFYRDVMGFTPTVGDEDDVYAEFDTGNLSGVGGATLALFQRELLADAIGTGALPLPAPGDQDTFMLTFLTENVDETARALGEKGALLVAPPQDRPDWGIRSVHFRDPNGYLVEISSPLAG